MTTTVAYRDDLEAAQLRLRDLEREHAALQARNAELEPLAPSKPETPVESTALVPKAPKQASSRRLADYTDVPEWMVLLGIGSGIVYACTVPLGVVNVLVFGGAIVLGQLRNTRARRRERTDGRRTR